MRIVAHLVVPTEVEAELNERGYYPEPVFREEEPEPIVIVEPEPISREEEPEPIVIVDPHVVEPFPIIVHEHITIHEPHPGLPMPRYELLLAAAYAALCALSKEQSIMLP